MANGRDSRYTRIEMRILILLSDGLDHSRKELWGCLRDELAPLSNIQPHISTLKKKLREIGQDIVCVMSNKPISYRQVRVLAGMSPISTPVVKS